MRCHFSTPGNCRDVTSLWNAATIDTHPRTSTTAQLQAAVKQLVQSANTTSTNRQYHQQLVTFVDFHEQVMHVPMLIPASQYISGYVRSSPETKVTAKQYHKDIHDIYF